MAKYISTDGAVRGIHAEKNQDAEVELADDGPAGYRGSTTVANGIASPRDQTSGFDIDTAPNGDLHMALRDPRQGSPLAADPSDPSGNTVHQHNQTDLDFVRSAASDDGPSTLMWDDTDIVSGITSQKQIAGELFQFRNLSGDWNGDGQDTVGVTGDFDGDGMVDAADYAL